VFNGSESACTASIFIETFSVMLTQQTNSRSVFSRTGQLADESSRQQRIFKNHGKYYYMYYYYIIIKIF